jgi:hypothetical protein
MNVTNPEEQQNIKYIDQGMVTNCAGCGSKHVMYIHRPTGKCYCVECFNKMFACNKCKTVTVNGFLAEKLWWCLNCYLKDFYGIVRRRPKTEKDFRILKELSKPIWQK